MYAIGLLEVVRAFAEHATAFDPPASAGGIDLGRTGRPVEATLGDTGFSLTMNAHREIVLRDHEDLIGLVREVRASLAERRHPVTKAERLDYVKACLEAGDEEWERAKASGTAQKWLKKVAS